MEGNIAVGHGPQERGVEELSSGSDWGGSNNSREFLGGPVIKTPDFHCRGHEFDPWSGKQDPACCTVPP